MIVGESDQHEGRRAEMEALLLCSCAPRRPPMTSLHRSDFLLTSFIDHLCCETASRYRAARKSERLTAANDAPAFFSPARGQTLVAGDSGWGWICDNRSSWAARLRFFFCALPRSISCFTAHSRRRAPLSVADCSSCWHLACSGKTASALPPALVAMQRNANAGASRQSTANLLLMRHACLRLTCGRSCRASRLCGARRC